jgi:excisionase family DNA binding protein
MDIKASLCFTSEAARLLKVNEMTVRKWADTGRISVVRTPGGVRVFDRAELERLAADRAVKAK